MGVAAKTLKRLLEVQHDSLFAWRWKVSRVLTAVDVRIKEKDDFASPVLRRFQEEEIVEPVGRAGHRLRLGQPLSDRVDSSEYVGTERREHDRTSKRNRRS